MVDNFHVAYFDASELRRFSGSTSVDDFGLANGLVVVRDEHYVVVQYLLEELGIGTKFGQAETFFEFGNCSLNCTQLDLPNV